MLGEVLGGGGDAAAVVNDALAQAVDVGVLLVDHCLQSLCARKEIW